jgi:hypothetical protein
VTTPNSFVKLTLPDGSEGRLPPNTVIRIRGPFPRRIDWVQMMLVREPPAGVATLVEGVLTSLGKLLLPDGSPVWFNAGAAQGPMPLPPERLQNGVHSGMMLGNKLQYLASTPEEVRDELIAKGGDALPVPAAFESLPLREQETANSRIAPMNCCRQSHHRHGSHRLWGAAWRFGQLQGCRLADFRACRPERLGCRLHTHAARSSRAIGLT